MCTRNLTKCWTVTVYCGAWLILITKIINLWKIRVQSVHKSITEDGSVARDQIKIKIIKNLPTKPLRFSRTNKSKLHTNWWIITLAAYIKVVTSHFKFYRFASLILHLVIQKLCEYFFALMQNHLHSSTLISHTPFWSYSNWIKITDELYALLAISL